ncbi:MAG: hypothetical protein K8E24_012940 [Methanobacterium paludis]|nr:hypothetical protein [Methanobacterium paludis]
MGQKRSFRIYINKRTEHDLLNKYNLKYPDGEKTFSSFVELLINRGLDQTC